MSKVAKIISAVASVVAVASQIAFFVTGNPIFLTISAVASAIATVSGAVAMATAKPPDMKGSVSQVVIGKNMAVPIALGITYAGGMQVLDTVDADHVDRTQIMVVSAAGPIESFTSFQVDYSTVNFAGSGGGLLGPGVASAGYYAADGGYMWLSTRKGLRPETAHVAVPPRDNFMNWGSAYKMSGYASYAVTMEFDEDGERYSGGVPQFGVIGKFTKQYDPRQDSTYPGGSGACRWNDEATFVFGTDGTGTIAPGENPALQGLTYARGRFIEKDAGGTPLTTPIKIAGCGLAFDEIEVAQFVELANICDANGWKSGGSIYEAPGLSKWDNLKRILQAAGAEPVWTGGKLGLRINAPRVAVGTITAADLADGEISVQAMKPWRDKINTVVPRVRLQSQKWEYAQLDPVTSTTYLTEDEGEVKTKEIQFDLVQNEDQGAQLAALALVDSREYGPVTLPLKPYYMPFKVGEALTVDLPEAGIDNQLMVMTARQIDPQTGTIMAVFESETTEKYDFVLGQTGVAPPSAVIFPPEDIDDAVSGDNTVPPDAATIELVSWTDRIIMKTDPIPRATEYRWRIYLSDGTTLKREIITAVPQVEYTKATAHGDGVSRSYKVEVAGVNAVGTGGALMSATISKPAPAAPTSVAFADGPSTSTVTFTASVSSGVAGYLHAYSTTSGFNPMTEGSMFTSLSSPAYTPQLPATTYYGKSAAYDLWSLQPDLLNFSAQDTFTITPGTGGSAGGGGGGGGFAGGGGGGNMNQN